MKTDLLDHITVVYVIGADPDGPVKVGRTSSLPQRMRDIQVGCWAPLRVFGVRFVAAPITDRHKRVSMRAAFQNGAASLEKRAHHKLRELDLGLHGEWFDVSATDALAVLDKVAILGGVRSVGLETLASADLSGRADKQMRQAHMKLLHEATALNMFIQGFNDRDGTCVTRKIVV